MKIRTIMRVRRKEERRGREGERERKKKERERSKNDIFYLVVYFRNGFSNLVWVRPKPGLGRPCR